MKRSFHFFTLLLPILGSLQLSATAQNASPFAHSEKQDSPQREAVVHVAPSNPFFLLGFILPLTQLENEIDIHSPAAEGHKNPKRLDRQVINVTKDGHVIVNSEEMTDDELSEFLNAVAKRRPDQSVLLRGHKDVCYKDIVRVLNICHQAKIHNVTLASTQKTQDNS